MRTIVITLFLVVMFADGALAHGAEVHGVEAPWTFDPWIVIPLLTIGLPYLVGGCVLWRRAALGHPVRAWQAVTFGAGWFTLAGALMSPLHWLGEHLFTFHMVEHEIVMAISAPLLVAGRPIGTMLWSLPRRLRVAVGSVPSAPFDSEHMGATKRGRQCDGTPWSCNLVVARARLVRRRSHQRSRSSPAAHELPADGDAVLVVGLLPQ